LTPKASLPVGEKFLIQSPSPDWIRGKIYLCDLCGSAVNLIEISCMHSKFILIYKITRWKKRGDERIPGKFLDRD